ncbi:MAG: LysR family transcriptional regulator [Aliiglaciecola sp.]
MVNNYVGATTIEQLNDLAVFVAVAEKNGFSAASKDLGITTAGVSKSVKRLEDRLGVRLFTRTTRKILLTNEGKVFYKSSKQIVEAAIEAENEIVDQSHGVTGRLRIHMPVLYGQQYIVPILAKFNLLYPAIDIDMRVSDERINLLESGADLAIRIGEQQDSSLRARKITDTRFVSCASPDYLQNNGSPTNLEQLAGHKCIAYILRTTGAIYPWTFRNKGQSVEFNPPYGLFVDEGGANKILGLQGCGIIHDLSLNLKTELDSGALIEVLSELSAQGPPIYLVYPDGHYLPKRTRLIIDFLVENLKKNTK